MLHTDIPTSADIEALAAVREEPCVSIYLPTSPVTPAVETARIELKNLVTEAMRQLAEAEAPRQDVTGIERFAEGLLTDAAFWTNLSNSLAIFLTPREMRTYRLPNRLSRALEVSDRFYIKPLLRAITFPHVAFVLALSQNAVRLIEVTPDAPAFEVEVNGLPDDLETTLGPVAHGRNTSLRFVGDEGDKVRMTQFSRIVDRALRTLLAGGDIPLILAATEPLNSIYRSVNTYPRLAADGIDGNPDALSDAELADAARTVLDGLYREEISAIRHRLTEEVPRQRVGADLQQVAKAATFGAIDTLLVDIDRHQPGFLDDADGVPTLNDAGDAEDYGVLDEIARRALRTGARVLAVRAQDIPDGAAVAALLRYPV